MLQNHLTDAELIAFVETTEITPSSLELLSRVTSHIVRCDQCRERLIAFQKMYGQLSAYSPAEETETACEDQQEVELA